MTIVAFDFGSRTGWAALDGGHIESGVQTFELSRGESPGMRFIRFRRWLEEMMALTKPGLCVYEAAHHRGGCRRQSKGSQKRQGRRPAENA